jgi:hypothetical protein
VCWTAQHRTVQCHPPDSLVHGPTNDLLSGILVYVGYNSPDHPRGAPDRPVCQPPMATCHVGREPTVNRSTKQSSAPTRQFGAPRIGNQPITWFCAHAPYSPVCTGQSGAPWTEGNQGLPNGAPTAPRYMELHTKQSLNILQRRDIEFMPLL